MGSTCSCLRTARFTSKQKLPYLTPPARPPGWVFSALQATVPTATLTEQESCDLCLTSLHQMAARQKLVPGMNFSFQEKEKVI